LKILASVFAVWTSMHQPSDGCEAPAALKPLFPIGLIGYNRSILQFNWERSVQGCLENVDLAQIVE